MNHLKPFEERSTSYLGVCDSENWRVKTYLISVAEKVLSRDEISQSMEAAFSHLPRPAATGERYGLGFLIIHRGVMRNWVLLDWWGHEDILHHRLFSSPLDRPGDIKPEADRDLMACVHELRVISFESELWIRTALAADGPDFEGYLAEGMGA